MPGDTSEHTVGISFPKHTLASAVGIVTPPAATGCAAPPGVGPSSNKPLAQAANKRDTSPNEHFGKQSGPIAPLPRQPPQYCALTTADTASMCSGPSDAPMRQDAQALILTHKRVKSVQRLVQSLVATAPTHTGKLHLRICVDIPKGKTEPNAELMAYLETLQWDKGMLEIGVQAKHAALIGQWLGCSRGAGLWSHGSSPRVRLPDVTGRSEVISILEDDIEVSPHWLDYVLRAHAAYKHDSHVVSYALQRLQLQAVTEGQVDRKPLIGSPVLLARMMSSWGFNARMDVWNDFLGWFDHASGKQHMPTAPGTVMHGWYQAFIKQGTTDRMWTMWFVDYCTRNNLLTVFGNPGQDLAWGLNWMEAGEHFSGSKVPKADSKPVQRLKDEVLVFPQRPVVLDWSGVPYNAAQARYQPSPTLETDAVQHMQCALARAAGSAEGALPLVAFAGSSNVDKARQWLAAAAASRDLQRRTVLVCEDEGCMGSLRFNEDAAHVTVLGHDPRDAGSASGRLGYLARVAAGGQAFAVFDVSAPWAGRVHEVFGGGAEGGSALRGGDASAVVSVVKQGSGEGAFMPYGFHVRGGEGAVQCLWAMHAAGKIIAPSVQHEACVGGTLDAAA